MRDAKKGTYNDELTYCPAKKYEICPYCDQSGICHIEDPIADCDDFLTFFGSWELFVWMRQMKYKMLIVRDNPL